MCRKRMRGFGVIVLATLGGCLAAHLAFAQAAGKFLMVKDGQPAAVIVIGGQATPDELFAAKELQDHIRKISGALIPIKNDREQTDGNIIAVGNNTINAATSLGTDKLEKEGFRIKIGQNILSLAGKDAAGTQFAVYTFLEQCLGVRWLWPGESGEVIPQMRTIEIAGMDITEQPHFKWRNRGPDGALWGATEGPTEMHARALLLGITPEHQQEVRLWEKRNKWGGMKIYGGHCLGEMFPPEKYARTHPEYYALMGGVRKVPGPDYDYKHEGQICTSNPEVIQVAVAWVRNFLNENPDFDGVHVTLNDSGGFCECANCLALDPGEESAKAGIEAEEMKQDRPRRRRIITDRVYTYVNEIAAEVQKTHPGKYVVSMAYGPYITPPKQVKLHPFTVPQYCLWSCYKHACPDFKKEHEEIASAWAKAANKKGIYEYFINGSWPGLHRLFPGHLDRSLKFLYAQGMDLYQTQSGDEFGTNGINYYLAGKLLWNSSLDAEKVMDDFYEKGFGKAAAPVRRFHQRLETAWNEATKEGRDVACNSSMSDALLNLYPPELLQLCAQDLDEAKKLADDPAVRHRVEFYQKGLLFTELSLEAARRTRELMDLGFELSIPRGSELGVGKATWKIPPEMDRRQAKEKVDAAVKTWETRNRLVEHLKNDYVIAYFWIVYNNLTRRFDQETTLKELAASLATP